VGEQGGRSAVEGLAPRRRALGKQRWCDGGQPSALGSQKKPSCEESAEREILFGLSVERNLGLPGLEP